MSDCESHDSNDTSNSFDESYTDLKYTDAVDYLNSFVNFERVAETRERTNGADLQRFTDLLTAIGSPHRQYPVIHVAGTKGKGSTAVILASILRASGLRVGLYTSPHLVTIRERMRVDGRMVSKDEFASLMLALKRAPEEVRLSQNIAFRTVFEHLTAMALLHFQRKSVDIAVVEAGMGGKLDTTVVLDPIISILTPVGLDHTAILGETISEIAWDKAHIIKPHTPAVVALQTKEATDRFVEMAEKVSALLTISEGRDEFRLVSHKLAGLEFVQKNDPENVQYKTRLSGNYQLSNISTVFTAVNLLRRQGWEIPVEAVRDGIGNLRWDGRCQIVSQKPLIVLDGAHNPLGVETMVKSIQERVPGKKWNIVFAAMKNKNIPEMLHALEPLNGKYFFCKIQFPKSWFKNYVLETMPDVLKLGSWRTSAPESYQRAVSAAGKDEGVLVIGSLYLVGEILRHLKGMPTPHSDGRIDERI